MLVTNRDIAIMEFFFHADWVRWDASKEVIGTPTLWRCRASTLRGMSEMAYRLKLITYEEQRRLDELASNAAIEGYYRATNNDDQGAERQYLEQTK